MRDQGRRPKPPAHWEWVARRSEAVKVPVFANGDLSFRTGGVAVRLSMSRYYARPWPGGARPDLVRQDRRQGSRADIVVMSWTELQPLLAAEILTERKIPAALLTPQDDLLNNDGDVDPQLSEATELFSLPPRERLPAY
jgi:tRNA-dihydrouridine synthase C